MSLERVSSQLQVTNEKKNIWFVQLKLINVWQNLKQTEVRKTFKSIIQNKRKDFTLKIDHTGRLMVVQLALIGCSVDHMIEQPLLAVRGSPCETQSRTLSQQLSHTQTREADACFDIRPAGERNAPQWLQLPCLPPPPPLLPLQSWIQCSSQLLPVRTVTPQNRANAALYWP